jgi:hypothetical protein
MLGAAIVAGLGVIVALSPAWFGSVAAETHADGAGPLASLNEPGTSLTDAVDPTRSHAGSWTFGMPLCIASGASIPVIDSVAPNQSVGKGYRFLGALAREFVPNSNDTPIISVDYYPPSSSMVPDTPHDIHGYGVTTRCSRDPGAHPYTELLIGMTVINSDGGGWQGVDVGYTVGGRHRILVINYGILICGNSVPQCAREASPSQ